MYATIYALDHKAGEEIRQKGKGQFSSAEVLSCNLTTYHVGYNGSQAATPDSAQLRPSAYHATLETFSDCLKSRVLGRYIRLQGRKQDLVEGFVNEPSPTDKSQYRSARKLTEEEVQKLSREVLAALKKK